jgi:hypothetical protein
VDAVAFLEYDRTSAAQREHLRDVAELDAAGIILTSPPATPLDVRGDADVVHPVPV